MIRPNVVTRPPRTPVHVSLHKGPGPRAGERSLGRAQNDKFLTVGVRNTPTMFCITSARVDESVAVAAPMPMVPTRAVMLTGAAAASAVVAATCRHNENQNFASFYFQPTQSKL